MEKRHAARPRLVVDNSSRIAGLGTSKVGLEFFQRPGREVAARLDAVKKFPVIDDNRRQPRFRNPSGRTELFCVLQKLISQGHFRGAPVSRRNHAVFIPRLSTGFIPRAKYFRWRDGSHTMTTLIQRIAECLKETGWSDRGASLKAGLHQGFIREIRRGNSKDPRPENLSKLAETFGRADAWLAKGVGRKARYGEDTTDREKRLVQQFRSMSPEVQDTAESMLAILARTEDITG